MDPRLLRTFEAVARCGSFTDAARELGVTRSAVSQHIASLEAELRAPLLTRQPVAPTAAGSRLLEHAGPLLSRLEAARADITRSTAPRAPRLTVGASPLALTPTLAEALAEAGRRHPDTPIGVRVLGRARIPAAVAAGDLDIGLTDGIATPGDPLPLPLPDAAPLAVVVLAETPLAVPLAQGHPLARRLGLRLADLAGARWVEAPDSGVSLGQLRAAADAPRGFRAALTYTGTDVRALVALAVASQGLTLLPHAVAESVPGVVSVPLTAPRLVHRVELVCRATLEGPAHTLVALAVRR
ncbi:LysR family transcriptional regulator [Streptomyces sp. SAJ15]|uniref:LysR family transcriptional regulator n=1 Tax=Streptomyces sp. SAJ15 TaxID=2011095 RepID=UPI001184ABC1|nr:LysR family transcriptional regulator [Streptomyces sp. SAJ15]TVL92807.1 LysR family transcriptional regulator [Streptomyces sp. SAJ15]